MLNELAHFLPELRNNLYTCWLGQLGDKNDQLVAVGFPLGWITRIHIHLWEWRSANAERQDTYFVALMMAFLILFMKIRYEAIGVNGQLWSGGCTNNWACCSFVQRNGLAVESLQLPSSSWHNIYLTYAIFITKSLAAWLAI